MSPARLFLSVALLLSSFAAPAANVCLPADPAVVQLSGVLERITFPGPPNYESIEAGDAAESYFVLRLAEPVCVRVSAQSSVSSIQLQLFLKPPQYEALRGYLGHKVSFSARLWIAETGHHHTPLMLTPIRWRAQ